MNDAIEPFENGRDGRGRFRPGCKPGPGNPGSRHAFELRQRLDSALFVVCDKARLVAVVDSILRLAECGDTTAAKLIFERISGPPISREITERLEALEARLVEANQDEPT